MDVLLSLELGGLLSGLPTLEEIIVWGGYLGLFAIIYAETGLLIGFLLPGDGCRCPVSENWCENKS